MTTSLSPTVTAETADLGPAFSARRVIPERFAGAADPIMGFDHYRMDAPTFAPHPHAGFSAISYLFEDSPGGLRNRDSLGHDFVVEPGGILWTQAGAGVLHDELPAEVGKPVHGLQIFINLSAAHKHTEPQVLRLATGDIPVWHSAGQSRLRVMVGRHGEVASPLVPTETANLFDLDLVAGDTVALPLAAGWDMLVYAERGTARVRAAHEEASLAAGDAVAAVAGDAQGCVQVSSDAGARLIVLSGRALHEPVAQYGPFIMSSEAELRAAMARYRRGEMGALEPLQEQSPDAGV